MQSRNQNQQSLEQISAIFDGEDLRHDALIKLEAADAREHLQNWSLIGAAMRDELPDRVNMTLLDYVMRRIEAEEPELVPQETEIVLPAKLRILNHFKKAGFVFAQLAIAATVAAVTVIGVQTYNASNPVPVQEPALADMGQVSGLNLASYHMDNSDVMIHVNSNDTPDQANINSRDQADAVNELKRAELNRINLYLRGYVLETAAK